MNATLKDQAVSIVRSDPDAVPELSTVGGVLNDIEVGTYRETVLKMRGAPAKGAPEASNKLESELPGIRWSGHFDDQGAGEPVEHSGLICTRFGNLGDKRADLKARLAADVHVVSAFDSLTPAGLEAVFRCDPHRLHWESFAALQRHVSTAYKINLDPACQDVAQMCPVSFDSDLHVNYEAVPVTYPEAPTPPEAASPDEAGYNGDSGPVMPEAYFDPERSGYWIQNNRSEWISINERQLIRHLKEFKSSKAEFGDLSQMEEHLNHLQIDCDINYAGPLAGKTAGLLEHHGNRVLVTKSPEFIHPGPGDWPILRRVFNNLLVDKEADQTSFLFGWLKLARSALISGVFRPGQALVIAGPRDCGKSLVQRLITPLLGGRMAKPYGWMVGKTDFNSDLFGAEHLVIEDEVASTDLRSRRIFGSKLKEVTVNADQECHPKHRPKLTLPPFWRTTITINDEPENLMVLPVLDESVLDKVILLRANKRPMPMPTTTEAERVAFMNRLHSELPAFCAFLEAWEIPDELSSPRFGITHYHHPDLLSAIDSMAPETRLWEMIETGILPRHSEWEGTAADLVKELTRRGVLAEHEVDKVFPFNTACAVYLARLMKDYPDHISKGRNRHAHYWVIKRGPDWTGPETGFSEEDDR